MKVDVSREEVTVKYTWFKSRAEQKVTIEVDFSEDEKGAMEMLGLNTHTLLTHDVNCGNGTCRHEISHILKTGNFGGSFASVLEANVFVTKAKDALVNLKKIIESQSAKPESESFEL